jgi:Ribonuclease G/E
MRVRVRGIYATALTREFLAAGHEVVQASGPIRRRFEASFDHDDHDVTVETTTDRQGVGVEGSSDATATAIDLLAETGVDTLHWTDPAPRGAVFDARVTDTLGRGAVCDLGDGEGFLPFDNADSHVTEGDRLRVQVTAARAPWSGDRAVLDTDLRASAGLAALVAGREGVSVDTSDEAAGRELAGMTDLLDVDRPEGWGVRWDRRATDASLDALSTALERAVDLAAELEDVRDRPVGDPGRLAAPTATAWVWFGRESRFALDERRREVLPTMPGHHRVKAASEAASAGVDFAEALCDPTGDGAFPFEVVTDQFGPVEGDSVVIGHGKPDGRLVTLGRGEVVDRDAEGTVAVERQLTGGGTYDALGTPQESGDTALTKFREGRWWYPTVYRDSEGNLKGTYVNVCTPVEVFPDQVRYVDLHVDVVKHADGRVERVDDDELDAAVVDGEVSEPLAEKARAVATSLENAL